MLEQWGQQGFVILPELLSHNDLAPAVAELGLMFPSAAGFHDGSDPRRSRFLDDEFDGIDNFPFTSTQVSLLAVHPKIVDLASSLLGTDDIRIYGAEAWAKYTGATSYDQDLHRDYLNHTVLVPSTEFRQVEMFVYLVDVPEELGPPHLLAREWTSHLPAVPNWFPRSGAGSDFVAPASPDLYTHEVSGAGPAGTVVAFETGTFHRGTELRRPGGARYSMHLNFRRATDDWALQKGWAAQSHLPAWYSFVDRASARQLGLFGFPPPGHPYWTPDTLAGMALRYPGLDLSPWKSASKAD
ncbi:hypothetical protein [Kutzneria sp. 744]|uniref:hypothetical protein n=1 Tax=Kutzneria sp. (strain 744) TaxID=345341 RepID=UPI0003EED2F3|nr:hypothetical protein [Kutzneria sp. 744]EWM19553.1 proteoglycan-4 [Kutzneria sp. 744]